MKIDKDELVQKLLDKGEPIPDSVREADLIMYQKLYSILSKEPERMTQKLPFKRIPRQLLRKGMSVSDYLVFLFVLAMLVTIGLTINLVF